MADEIYASIVQEINRIFENENNIIIICVRCKTFGHPCYGQCQSVIFAFNVSPTFVIYLTNLDSM